MCTLQLGAGLSKKHGDDVRKNCLPKKNLALPEKNNLTAVFFETGAMPTPTKSRNLTNCG